MLFKNIKKLKNLYKNDKLVAKKCEIFHLNLRIIITFKN